MMFPFLPKKIFMRSPLYFLGLGLAVVLVGCGGGKQLSPVTGKVTLDGNPLPNAIVVFAPAEGGRTNSVATTDDSGMYSLNYASEEGTQPGKYNVLVSKSKYVGEREVEQIPRRYNEQTDLSVEVTEEGPNQFDFDLQTRN